MEILNRFIKNKKAGSETEEKVVISKLKPHFEVVHEY